MHGSIFKGQALATTSGNNFTLLHADLQLCRENELYINGRLTITYMLFPFKEGCNIFVGGCLLVLTLMEPSCSIWERLLGHPILNKEVDPITSVCLMNRSSWTSYLDCNSSSAVVAITGVEYQAPVGALLGDVNDRNVPCAACYTAERAVKIMIPGRVNCMPSWTREYYGYLMAERDQNFRNSFECVDVNAEVLPNSAPDRNGALFYHAEARQCQGTQCLPTPYSEGNELTCVVCTK